MNAVIGHAGVGGEQRRQAETGIAAEPRAKIRTSS